MPPPPPLPSQASLTSLLAAAQRAHNPKHISPAQLERYVTQWFPRRLWRSAYAASISAYGAPPNARTPNPFLRFCRDPPHVSAEWTAALQLVALSRYVSDPAKRIAGDSPTGRRDASASPVNPTIQTIEHLLRFGVFPPAGWSVTLELLHTWRREQQKQRMTSSHSSPPDGPQLAHTAMATSPSEQPPQLVFPGALQTPAMAQLLYHISLAPPSLDRWQDALRLYQLSAAQTYTSAKEHHMRAPPAASSGAVSDVTPATSAFLKALRHMTLTTLLQAGEWERGLHFYYHSLYQRDLPGTVTTGYLVQALGRAEKWAAVLQVYDLCVKLLHAQRQMRLKSDPSGHDASSRTWGTTLSMAMAAVQRCPTAPPAALLEMVQQLEREKGHGNTSSSLPPLVQLDGNFLSAVQALAQEADRAEVLRYAKRKGLLDTFKLIRGLLSKHRWEEALMLFTEAMKTAAPLPSPGPGGAESTAVSTTSATARGGEEDRFAAHLSRREIGETRLNFLHSSTVHTVSAVVAVLNRHRNDNWRRNKGQIGGAVTNGIWALNDQEVECVLSKTLEINEAAAAASSCAADFWQYCLQLLDHNYAALNSGLSRWKDIPSASATAQRSEAVVPLRSAPQSLSTSSSRQRRPTTSALSFLLRHPRLPWRVALQLIETYDLLDAARDRETTHKKGRGARSATHYAGNDRRRTDISVTPRSLALNAAVERLASQGQQKAAEELALRALDVEVSAQRHSRDGVSLPADLLQVVSFPTLQELLLVRRHDGLYVEKRVLFHLLRESVGASRKRNEALSCRDSAVERSKQSSDKHFVDHPCGRALTVVHLLMQRTAPSRDSSAVKTARTLQQLPASLFLLEARSSKSTEAPHTTPEMLPSVPWLLAYPPAVHCAVVHVIRCMTTCTTRTSSCNQDTHNSSVKDQAREYDTQRWTWTMRYLRILADAFAWLQRRASDGARDTQQHGFLPAEETDTVEKAQEAYYVSTFEAVISLLDTSAEAEVPPLNERAISLHGGGGAVPSAAEQAKGQEMESGQVAVPRTSEQRAPLLCQLLERAIARYGCFPPTHMFLPNQLDRLLPPLVKHATPRKNNDEILRSPCGGTSDHACTDAQGRCAVAACLIQLVLHSVDTASPDTHTGAGAPRQLRAVEPALLHNALKLCCRVAEYRRELSFTLPHTAAAITADGAALCEAGGALVRLQCERCGLPTVRPGTLSLLYHLCAAVEACAPHARPSLPKKVALETTEYLLRQQACRLNASSPNVLRGDRSGPPALAPHRGENDLGKGSLVAENGNQRREGSGDGDRMPAAAVQTHHCELFFSLFGWEDTLHVWYPAFPRDVLLQLSGDPLAIEACLKLEECVGGDR